MRSKDLLVWLNAAHVADRVFMRCKFVLLFFSLLRGHPSRESAWKEKTMEWYVLQFTTTRFAAVFAHLERLNFSYFCPMETERYRRPDKIISYRERRLPLFPGYLFIQADFEEVHSTTITAIPYVQRFISFGGEPLPVPEDVMAELLCRQSHTTAQANILRKSIPHEFAEILLMDNPQQRSMAFIHYITERSLTHKMKRKKNDCYPEKKRNETQAPT